MRIELATTLLSLLLGTGAAAQDFLVTSGPLSDRDFYRLVACGALPGKGCSDRIVRWPADEAMDIGIGLAAIPQGYPAALAQEIDAAINRAIATINEAGAAVRLRRVTKSSEADIRIHLTNASRGRPITGTGHPDMDGVPIGAALVNIRWNLAGEITQGTVAVANDLPLHEAFPVLLEEITQALGLMTDIRNPHYEDLSVFSEDSNSVTKLAPQDVIALRLHYPPP